MNPAGYRTGTVQVRIIGEQQGSSFPDIAGIDIVFPSSPGRTEGRGDAELLKRVLNFAVAMGLDEFFSLRDPVLERILSD